MATLEIRAPRLDKNLFHIAYASRAKSGLKRSGVTQLADHAARANAPRGVSGVLIQDSGRFLQWLEGPLHQVCGVMARITNDPRHTDITVLAADWASSRRFSRWPMQLAEAPSVLGSLKTAGGAPQIDPRWAEAVFAGLADDHHRQGGHDAARRAAIETFAAGLVKGEIGPHADFPELATPCLYARAAVVDDVCAALRRSWREDAISQSDIIIALAYLTRFWRRFPPVADPLRPARRVAVVAPPGAWELIGAIIKVDLLRASGVAAALVVEPDDASTLQALARMGAKEIIIAGPRVGLAGDAARTLRLAEKVREGLPETPVHLGGRAFGPLNDWGHRMARRSAAPAQFPRAAVEWLALSALGELTQIKTAAPAH